MKGKSQQYTAHDLVPGPKEQTGRGRRLANGALAGYIRDPHGNLKWRILRGASPEYMRQISRGE